MYKIIEAITNAIPPNEIFHWGIDLILLYLLWRKDKANIELAQNLSKNTRELGTLAELLRILVYGRRSENIRD